MAFVTNSLVSDFILLVISITFGLYLYTSRNFKYWKNRGVPQIEPRAFFGNLGSCIFARKSLADVLRGIYEAGAGQPYIGFYALDKPYLMIRDLNLITRVLIKDFSNFSDRIGKPADIDKLGNSALLMMKNPFWKITRQKIRANFSTGKLKNMVEAVLAIEKDFDLHLKSLNLEGEGRNINVKETVIRFTLDAIGVAGYGIQFKTLIDPDAAVYKLGKNIFSKSYKRYLQSLCVTFIPHTVELFGFHFSGREASLFLGSLFRNAMDQRIATAVKSSDLMDILINLKNEQEKLTPNAINKLPDDIHIAQAISFFQGALETSSMAMYFALYELAKNLELQNRLRTEISDALSANEGELTYDMLTTSFPYLSMVISETLRLYPLLVVLDRKTHSDYHIAGTDVVLEAGTPVIIPMVAIHMDEEYFPNPHIFDPERFSETNKESIKKNSYLPFGDGPRMCIGMRLGILMVKIGLIHMVRKGEFSLCEETPVPIVFDTKNRFLSAGEKMMLRVKKIES